jgi:hypothetical protein
MNIRLYAYSIYLSFMYMKMSANVTHVEEITSHLAANINMHLL